MALKPLTKPSRHFPLGNLVTTHAVDDFIQRGPLNPAPYIARHLKGG